MSSTVTQNVRRPHVLHTFSGSNNPGNARRRFLHFPGRGQETQVSKRRRAQTPELGGPCFPRAGPALPLGSSVNPLISDHDAKVLYWVSFLEPTNSPPWGFSAQFQSRAQDVTNLRAQP